MCSALLKLPAPVQHVAWAPPGGRDDPEVVLAHLADISVALGRIPPCVERSSEETTAGGEAEVGGEGALSPGSKWEAGRKLVPVVALVAWSTGAYLELSLRHVARRVARF